MSGVPTGKNIPRRGKDVLRRGDVDPAVWAMQRMFSDWDDWNHGVKLVADGEFGDKTYDFVRRYQEDVDLTADGVVGPVTQQRFVPSCRRRAEKIEGTTPKGLVDGQAMAESGGVLSAVNWSVWGGVDCGLTQRRVAQASSVSKVFWMKNLDLDTRGNVIGPNRMLMEAVSFSESSVQRAFDPMIQFRLLVKQLIGRVEGYLVRNYVAARPDRNEYAWRLAALEHNWPYGAEVLASGRQLSTVRASWVPTGAKFTDGTPVVTFRDWAKFYAMGSHAHNHKGVVVQQAYGVPRDG